MTDKPRYLSAEHTRKSVEEAYRRYPKIMGKLREYEMEDEVRTLRNAAVLANERAENAIELAAKKADAWDDPQYVRLMAGEMTAKEMHTVRAVVRAIARQIREMKDE